MLRLVVPGTERWDEEEEIFVTTKEQILQLEHSLVSVSRWESQYKRSFLSDSQEKTPDELKSYIKFMTINNQGVSDLVYDTILTNADLITQITEYIDDPMTATTFAKEKAGSRFNPKKSIITAEIIYYWMVTFQIPFECQKWHLNRLLTLIRVLAIKNSPSKKMSKSDIYARNRALNEQRRAAMHTTG